MAHFRETGAPPGALVMDLVGQAPPKMASVCTFNGRSRLVHHRAGHSYRGPLPDYRPTSNARTGVSFFRWKRIVSRRFFVAPIGVSFDRSRVSKLEQ